LQHQRTNHTEKKFRNGRAKPGRKSLRTEREEPECSRDGENSSSGTRNTASAGVYPLFYSAGSFCARFALSHGKCDAAPSADSAETKYDSSGDKVQETLVLFVAATSPLSQGSQSELEIYKIQYQ
jgi:hypothetical protein